MRHPPPDTRRNVIARAFGPTLFVGLWLLVAWRLLGFSGADSRWNDAACGAILVLLAVVGGTAAHGQRRLHLVSAIVGAWLVAASLTVEVSTGARLNDGIAGVVVFMLALSGASAADEAPGPPIGGHHRR